METKTALVTGANKGIGLEIARGLAEAGLTVLLGSRDEQRGQAAVDALRQDDRLDVRPLSLDVTDSSSIENAAKHIAAEYGSLDVLVNNAGITGGQGEMNGPSTTSAETVRAVFDTNVFGVIAVTNAMLPLLRRSPAGRVVNMSSELGSLGWLTDAESPYYEINYLAYNTSKSALNSLTIAYAKELRDTAVKVNAVTPGYCATDLNHHTGFRTPEQGAAIAIQMALLDADGPTGGFFNDEGPCPW